MKNFLRVTVLAICAIFMVANASAQDNYDATKMGAIVRYYETAKWGQQSPFNDQIYTEAGGSTHGAAGCVPTAYAIIMRYWGFPAEGTSSDLRHCQTNESITDRTYDWSKMPLTNGNGWTDEQRNEVSKLFAHVLHAVFPASIGSSYTDANEGGSTSYLETHFGYTNISSSQQWQHTKDAWEAKMKESLDNGCPIPYASKNTGTGDARHMFVIDGYTTEGYYHINFGWNGYANGWHKLDEIKPADSNGNLTGDNYSWVGDATSTSAHKAFFNLAPKTEKFTVTATATPSNMGTVSINGGTAGTTASAEINENFTATLTAHPAQGYALANWTKNGVIVGTKNTLQVKVGASDNDYVANFDDEANVLVEKDCTFNISSVEISGANGSYCSTWTTSDGIVLSCSKGSEPAYALSTTVNTFFAKAPVGNSETLVSDITYTLTAPAGYIIKSYSFKGKSPSSSYTIDVTIGGNTTNVTNASAGVVLSASDINAQSTSFILGSNYAGRAGLAIMDGVTVTIQSEGGASTPTPDPEPEPDPTPTTYAVTTTANPAAGGTAKFAVGTGSQKTQGDVENGTQITLYAVANTGYNFVNWTLGGNEVSTSATCHVTVSQASSYVANFEAEAQEPEYPEPTGATYQNNYLTSVTTTGANENISYTANAHPGDKLVTLPGTVRIEQGKSFTLNLVAKSLSSSTSSVSEDMRYCHASLFTDFDGDRTFGTAVQTWGNQPPTNNVAGNYSSVMNITHEITVPADAPLGTSHVRMIYTNAWKGWPTNGTAELDKGIVYDIPVEVVEASNEKTLNVTFANATWGNAANGYYDYVTTNTTPAVTVRTNDGSKSIGYSTISSVWHPYLLHNNNFTISLPANCKITGYRLTYKGHDFGSNKTFTYTTAQGSTTETITQNGVEKTLTVTGLENSEIAINVSDNSSKAGVIITALEITYVENEFEPAMFKAEIEGWRDNNPNTHLGTITIGGTAIKLTPEHLNASELTMPVVEGTTLAFTRKYRGFEFQGFYIGETSLGTNPTLTADNVAAINETTPLVAKFTATDDVTLFYDDDQYSYRIPAIAKTGNGMLVAVSDYRHNLDDIGRDNHGTGTKRIDLVMRTSTDNGATWSETKTIAAGDNSKAGSYLRAFGDAAIAAVGQNIVVMAAAGDVVYTAGTTSSPNKMARIYSSDNGATWAIEEMTTKMYSQSTSLIPSGGSAFFGSGKLAVDPNFNGTGNARIYGALLVRIGTDGYNNFGVFSDDFGATWKILGGDNTNPVAKGDEPKVEILPNGQILLSARRGGGRVFRVFTYGDDKANGAGSWGDAAVNGCDNGGSNATNGEIICLDAKRPNGKPTKILLQSQPKGGSGQYDRKDVTIWYKEVSSDETYTSATIASGWTMGKQVSTVQSSYSAMCLQANGEIALFFEEAPCYGNDYTKGYSMVYVPLTIEEITNNNFLNPNADVEYVPVEFNIELTDTEGNIYRETLDYVPNDAAAVATYLTTTYPFITLGENGAIADNTYTNTVTLPFKVSNANTTVWHNIYWPANTAENDYPIYLSASAANDTYVPKVTESKTYGESTYNTLQNGDKISWAIYSVDNTLTFKFKNKLTGKYIQATSVATGNAQNVVYANENNATAFELLPDSYSYAGDYALVAKVGETTGYLCSTSATGYHYATHYNGSSTNRHEGAWVKFVEAPDYQAIIDQLIADINNFGAGEGKYTANDAISSIDKDALATMPINSLNTQKENVQTVKDSYSEITLSIPVANSGSVKIKNEAVSNKFVQKGEVTIEAVPAAGYRFVNWTRPAAQTNAAARAAEARNAVEVVSTDNPYTFNLTDAVSLEANFEEILVNVTLTDAQSNTYNVELSGFTSGVTKETVDAKLKEAYPYITLGSTDQNGEVIDLGVLEANGTAYTYTNKVELPFKVSNAAYLWHNIYYPSNGGNPNYIAALNEDEVVDMAASGSHAYGDNPTYNTKDGGNSICWAIYNVNNSFEFIFKSRVTGKYIKVESVSSETTENVKFVENAEDATVFTLLVDTGTYNGDYALVANIEGTTGYLCATSSSTNYLTHFVRNNHQGAWVKFVEAPDYFSMIQDLGIALGYFFGDGDKKCIIPGTDIEPIDAALKTSSGSITLNELKEYALTIEEAMATWPTIRLSVAPDESGTVTINGEEGVTSKRAPDGHEFPIAAVPAEGYHFVNWTKGDDVLSSNAEHAVTISGVKGEITDITANFEINTYTVSVTAGEGGSASASAATVEHGSEVTLTATSSSGYSFAGWYDGENLISAEASYTFTVTSHINYTARFNEVPTGTVAIHITVASTDGTEVTNNTTGNVKAIINNIGQEWATDADFVVGADVELVATNDYDQKAYLFDGWYKNGNLVSEELAITVQATEVATYEARFFRGCVVIGEPKSNRMGYVTKITLADGTSLGYDASNRAVVKAGTTVKINTYIEKGYTVGNWTDVNSNVVSEDESLIIEVNEDVTYTANFEPVSYKLTVSANDDSYGTVSATSGTATGTTIKVGHKMEATITATVNTGYYFVNWTKGTEVVSTSATYTIEGISEYDDMVDVEYVANFLPVENATAGVYYRIAYDFPAAASAGAARAATDETHTYIVSPNTGTPNDAGTFSGSWTYTKNGAYQADLTMVSTSNGTSVNKINTMNNGIQHSLAAYYKVNGVVYGVTYTVSVPENGNYKIAGYSIGYTAYQNVTVNSTATNHNNTGSIQATGLDVYSFDFTVSSTSSSGAIDITNFEVYIQQVDGGAGTPETPEPETPANRYYMQSVACGVSGGNNLQNALKMTQETGAASIFYYADSKLLSYDKGTYVKEDGTTRGLQAVGTSGTVTITTSGETTTIAAPSYLHAVDGTTRYVDHCGSNPDNHAANHNFVLEEVTTLPVTISSALHATFYAPVAVEIPEGVKAYVLKAEDIPGIETYAWMTSLKNGIIPANTGVIIKGAEGTYYFDIVENNDAARAEAVGNVLSGTVAKTKIIEDAYILANREGKIGLYPVAKNSYLDNSTIGTTVRFTNNSHKAYLPVTDDWFGEQLKKGTGFRFVYDDEETTGIDEFETELEDTIYDLQGRKLSEITEPGIYIVGGKKVWIK